MNPIKLCMWGITYSCEQFFSSMKNFKTAERNRLTYRHLANILRIKNASFDAILTLMIYYSRLYTYQCHRKMRFIIAQLLNKFCFSWTMESVDINSLVLVQSNTAPNGRNDKKMSHDVLVGLKFFN